MKVASFTGKSGTGKSFQATALAQRRGFDAIIDDGLLIYKGQIVAGRSAKKCASKAAAMRTALFNYEDHPRSWDFRPRRNAYISRTSRQKRKGR